jgi:protein TonB
MASVPVHSSAKERAHLYPSAALALITEVLLLAGVFVWLTHRPAAEPPPPPTLLSLAPPDVPKPPAPPQPVPAPTPPKPVTPVKPAPRPKVVEHVRHVVHATPPKPTPTPPVPTPAPALPMTTPTDPPALPAAPAAPPPPPAPPAAPHADPSFESALREAIQSALRYPEAARMDGMDGRARVAFDYRDGAVSNVRLVASSGVGMLDRAALAAVRDASYPKPAPALVGKTLSEQLWVTFNLNDQQ